MERKKIKLKIKNCLFTKTISVLSIITLCLGGVAFSQYELQVDKSANYNQNIEEINLMNNNQDSDKYKNRDRKDRKDSKPDPEEEWLYYHNESGPAGETGIDYFNFVSAIKFDVSDISQYDGESITQFKVYGGDTPADAELKIWQGPDDENLTEVYSQNILADLTSGAWRTIDLNTPYEIDGTKKLFVGVKWKDRGDANHPAPTDSLTSADGKGNLFTFEEEPSSWNILSDQEIKGDWLKEINVNGDWLYWHEFDSYLVRIGIASRSWHSSIRFDTNDLTPYNGWTIEKFRVYINEAPWRREQGIIIIPVGVTMKIWQGSDASNLTEVMTQDIPASELNDGQWTEIELNTPYLINPGEELFVGVEWVDMGEGFYPTSFDNATDADEKGNMIRKEDEWTTLTQLGHQGDWLKEILVIEGDPQIYNIAFDVKDINDNPITGATIKLENITNSPGDYTFDQGYFPGVYNYNVSKAGYNAVNDYVRVINEDVIEEVILVKDYTSINEELVSSIEVYPNPANKKINIKSNSIVDQIKIIDTSGRVIKSNVINDNEVNIDIQNIDQGFYILKIFSNEKIINKKIQIIK